MLETVTKGFRHSSIPTAEKVLGELAEKSGAFTVDYVRTDEEMAQKMTADALKEYDGVIFAKGRVEIEAKGVVTGEVHAPCMVIDPGGIFDGRCHMLASSDAVSSVTIPIRAASTA